MRSTVEATGVTATRVDEAHVEHAVGLVEYEKLDIAEPQTVALHEIEQTSGSGHHDFDALHDRADLTSHRHTADRKRRSQSHMTSVGVEAFENLSRQFTGWAEHENAASFGLRLDAMLEDAMQDRKRKGCSLAGAGLGDADDVASGER
jgi:hypothetical protein